MITDETVLYKLYVAHHRSTPHHNTILLLYMLLIVEVYIPYILKMC